MLNSDSFVERWKKADWHIRGCMLESLSQELDLYGVNNYNRMVIIDILRRIAATVK